MYLTESHAADLFGPPDLMQQEHEIQPSFVSADSSELQLGHLRVVGCPEGGADRISSHVTLWACFNQDPPAGSPVATLAVGGS